ncbi:MoaD/ThiS family protein [Moorella sp. ACPs]|uniref:MoaD/ThiS family protein n=1 Tax=Neomoorella carbonis TaxID=3062783 RepID=UPI003243EDFA
MRITVRYLGPASSFSNSPGEILEFAGPVSLQEVMDTLTARHNISFTPPAWAFLLNGRGVTGENWADILIEADAEITILPHLSGG